MRRTARMQALEKEHGRPIEEIVRAALERDEAREDIAKELGISRQTLELWRYKLRIEVRREAVIG